MQKMLVTFPAPTGPTTIWSSPYKKKKKMSSKYILFLSLKHTKIFWYQSMTNDMTISCLVLLKEKNYPFTSTIYCKKSKTLLKMTCTASHIFLMKNTITIQFMSEACLQWLKQVQKRPKGPIYSTARCTLKKKRRKKKNGLYRVNYWLLLKFYRPP